ncbi:hypothetical protein HER32_06690 [Hymenobacter sp. BT18]|uniref:hypothetical protein n=1 Tax=Hymenobacter sp. BT18 TaxID=2835648 RepID=UPI00143E53C0|nr:hypothetical protein [Hymenobacter sp. BT18]QIX60880.1 hypothetical protein HER32_06690 [Hymenobacter sp. BT18]
MELSKIVSWLSSAQDFADGVALYAAAGTSQAYKHLFTLGETSYSRQVLVRELRQIVATEPTSAAVGPVTRALVPAPVVAPDPAPKAATPAVDHSASPALAKVRDELRVARDERSRLHAQLTAPRLARKDRYTMVARIVALTDQVTQLLEAEAHVLEHGRLPGKVPAGELTDAGEMRQRLDNLRSQRSKLRKQPQKADQLAQVEADIQTLEINLKNS